MAVIILTEGLLDHCSQCTKCANWFPDQKVLEEYRQTEHPETEVDLTSTGSHMVVHDRQTEHQEDNRTAGMQIPGAFHLLTRPLHEFRYLF